ncbi:MAG: Co2+/Mg2+ efflux protein ApaG [Mariprofundaceae bacterium]|nr:Co2+/Mg2+ efflux protein ApaG [Mariprofundaceae bacterium]
MKPDDYAVAVHMRAVYAREHSDPDQEKYVFKYDVCIRNIGALTIQLISRHWIITDGDAKVEEVRGEGVIGEQPVLSCGQTHRYQSFCVLKTSVGCMQGSFQMKGADGLYFDAPIDILSLAIPGVLN